MSNTKSAKGSFARRGAEGEAAGACEGQGEAVPDLLTTGLLLPLWVSSLWGTMGEGMLLVKFWGALAPDGLGVRKGSGGDVMLFEGITVSLNGSNNIGDEFDASVSLISTFAILDLPRASKLSTRSSSLDMSRRLMLLFL